MQESLVRRPALVKCMLAELLGTFILVFFGCGVVHTSLLFGANQGLWQIAIVWGLAIMLAIYAFGSTSGCHINPAITLALACWDGFDKRRVVPYWVAQFAGAFIAAALLFAIFSGKISQFEAAHDIQRDELSGRITASMYGEFSPNPASSIGADGRFDLELHEAANLAVPTWVACLCEGMGTAILAFVVFAIGDLRNTAAPEVSQRPVFVGLTVAALICVFAPVTQAGFNPARDFGPRMFAFIAGWGNTAFPIGSDWKWLIVYVLSPCAGAVIGGLISKKFFGLA